MTNDVTYDEAELVGQAILNGQNLGSRATVHLIDHDEVCSSTVFTLRTGEHFTYWTYLPGPGSAEEYDTLHEARGTFIENLRLRHEEDEHYLSTP